MCLCDEFDLKLNISLFLSDRVKAEMDLKELSETVQQQQQQQNQQQGGSAALTTPKRPIRSLDKTIESCKAQLGTCTITSYSTCHTVLTPEVCFFFAIMALFQDGLIFIVWYNKLFLRLLHKKQFL